MDVYLTGVQLIGVDLMGVYLMGVVTGNSYHIWLGDHTRTFCVPHRSGGGAGSPGVSCRVHIG